MKTFWRSEQIKSTITFSTFFLSFHSDQAKYKTVQIAEPQTNQKQEKPKSTLKSTFFNLYVHKQTAQLTRDSKMEDAKLRKSSRY